MDQMERTALILLGLPLFFITTIGVVLFFVA